MAGPQLVVGLGNPGPNYAQTRHNLGFMVADRLAARVGSNFKVHKRSGAEIVTGRLGGRSVVLAKPRCYMNESGRQVGPLAKFYSVPPADVLIIHDELDIEFGQTSKWVDDQLIVISAFYDAAQQAKQLGLA